MYRAAIILLLASSFGAAGVVVPVVTGVTARVVNESTDQVTTVSTLLDVPFPADRALHDSHQMIGLFGVFRMPGWFWYAGTGAEVNTSDGDDRLTSEILRNLFATEGSTHTFYVARITMDGDEVLDRCVGWGNQYNSAEFPTGGCLDIPPTASFCTMVSPALTFDHGVVNVVDQSDTHASAELLVECTVGTTVRLSLSGGDVSRMAIGGGTATLAAEGAELGGPLHLSSGANTLHLTSEIQGVASGSWSASGVLVIEPA